MPSGFPGRCPPRPFPGGDCQRNSLLPAHRSRGSAPGCVQAVPLGRPRAPLRAEPLRPVPRLGELGQGPDLGAELPAVPGGDLAHGQHIQFDLPPLQPPESTVRASARACTHHLGNR